MPVRIEFGNSDSEEEKEEDKKEENINKLATKFMKACGYFNEGQYIYGPAMLIDNWYL